MHLIDNNYEIASIQDRKKKSQFRNFQNWDFNFYNGLIFISTRPNYVRWFQF
jgi:hypothetical protein